MQILSRAGTSGTLAVRPMQLLRDLNVAGAIFEMITLLIPLTKGNILIRS